MKQNIVTLKRQAGKSMRWRGHTPGKWSRQSGRYSNNACLKCGMECQINNNPLPNEIDIGGSAVALNCKSRS